MKATPTSHFIDKSPDKNNDHLYSVDQALVLLHYIKTCNSLHCGLEKDLVVIQVFCLLCRIYIDIKVWSAWTCWTARTNCALYLFRLISSYPKDGARGGPYSIMPCSALWRWRAWEISWGWAELVKGCFLTRSILLFFWHTWVELQTLVQAQAYLLHCLDWGYSSHGGYETVRLVYLLSIYYNIIISY